MRVFLFLVLFGACAPSVTVEVVHRAGADSTGDGDDDLVAGDGDDDLVAGEGEGDADPVEPDPVDPVEPDPVDPVEPDPVDPVEPDPADPVEPDPVDPDLDGGRCDENDLPTPNAGLVEALGIGGCPDGMAPVGGAFCMDQFEAFLETTDGTPWSPFEHPGSADVVARSAAGAVPQGYISGVEAAAACGNAGKRLCSDSEWLRACQGAATTTYPYGNVRQNGVCNDARAQHPAVEYFGTSANWIWSELGHPCINQLDNSVDKTGANVDCVNDEGHHFDLMGNLHEWTSDPAGTFRGGFYVDTRINGEGCRYRTTAHDRSHWDYSTGFRCCAD